MYSLEILEDTSSIVFHTSQMNLGNVSVSSSNLQGELKPTSQTLDPITERSVLEFSNTFTAGTKVQLKAKFDAGLTGSMMGYYYSSWENKGKKEYYTLTQFEVCGISLFFSTKTTIEKGYLNTLANCCSESIPVLGRASVESNLRYHYDLS